MKPVNPGMDSGGGNRAGATQLDQTIAAIRAGNINLYRGIVEAYEGNVRAVVGAMIPDASLVPDMTQEVFLIAYQRLSTYRPGSNFAAWLRAIARNVAQNERRRWYRRRDMEERFRTEVGLAVAPHVDRILDEMPEDLLGALKDCVSRLQGRSQKVMDGFYYQDCPIADLAGRLQISLSSAKVILHRARQAIGSCLQKKGRCHV